MEKIHFNEDVPPRTEVGGYVYLFGFGNSVKIGHSIDPRARKSTIVGMSGRTPDNCMCSQLLDDPYVAEQQIHKFLSDFRAIGEYFSISAKEAALRLRLESFEYTEPSQTKEGHCGQDIVGQMTISISDRDSRMIEKLLAPIAAKFVLLAVGQVLTELQLPPKGTDDYFEEMSDLIAGEMNRQLSITKGADLSTVQKHMLMNGWGRANCGSSADRTKKQTPGRWKRYPEF